MTVSRLLKSCATPLVSWPTASRRCIWRSVPATRSRSSIWPTSWLLEAASSSVRSVTRSSRVSAKRRSSPSTCRRLGQVLHRADHAQCLAVGVAGDEAAVEHLGVAAVGAAEAIVGAPARRRARDGGTDAVDDAAAVVGMDVALPLIGRAFALGMAEQLEPGPRSSAPCRSRGPSPRSRRWSRARRGGSAPPVRGRARRRA